jgi:hypothetical protein
MPVQKKAIDLLRSLNMDLRVKISSKINKG